MKKKLMIIPFLIILVCFLVLYKNADETNSSQVIVTQESEKVVSNKIKVEHKQNDSQQIERRPAQASFPIQKVSLKRKVSPQKLELDHELRDNIFIIKNVTAIPRSKYKSFMGDVIYEDPIFNYINSKDSDPQSLSIYDAKKKRISSISHIIKIRHVDEVKREEIISRGFRENLYLEKLQLLFIETNTTDFSVIYERLKSEGFTPEYQVRDRQYFPM